MVRGPEVEAERLAKLYRAKANAELHAADALVSGAAKAASHGDPIADTLLLKGAPGPADVAASRALAGEDAEAARKSLAALGRDQESVYYACTRPQGDAKRDARVRRVALIVEAVDPRLVIALDPVAGEDLSAACGAELVPGRPVEVLGRTMLAVDGLEASLADEGAKARVWAQLKSLASGEKR